jgi:lysophospholipase L1-like esterase
MYFGSNSILLKRKRADIFVIWLISLFFGDCYSSKTDPIAELSLLSELLNRPIRILIVGDSLSVRSNGFGLSERLAGNYEIKDISVSGRSTRDWYLDRTKIIENSQDIILFALGTNDANQYSADEFPAEWNRLSQWIENHSFAILLTTLSSPTRDTVLGPKIRENNTYLRNRVPARLLIDMESQFPPESLDDLYPDYDLIHPHPIGYEIMGKTYAEFLIRIGLSI